MFLVTIAFRLVNYKIQKFVHLVDRLYLFNFSFVSTSTFLRFYFCLFFFHFFLLYFFAHLIWFWKKKKEVKKQIYYRLSLTKLNMWIRFIAQYYRWNKTKWHTPLGVPWAVHFVAFQSADTSQHLVSRAHLFLSISVLILLPSLFPSLSLSLCLYL